MGENDKDKNCRETIIIDYYKWLSSMESHFFDIEKWLKRRTPPISLCRSRLEEKEEKKEEEKKSCKTIIIDDVKKYSSVETGICGFIDVEPNEFDKFLKETKRPVSLIRRNNEE